MRFFRVESEESSRDTTSFVDPSRTTTSTTSATIAAFQNLDAVDGASVVLNDADDGVPRTPRWKPRFEPSPPNARRRRPQRALDPEATDVRTTREERRRERDTPSNVVIGYASNVVIGRRLRRARVLRRSTLRAIPRSAATRPRRKRRFFLRANTVGTFSLGTAPTRGDDGDRRRRRRARSSPRRFHRRNIPRRASVSPRSRRSIAPRGVSDVERRRRLLAPPMRRDDERGRRRRERRYSPSIESTRFVPALPIGGVANLPLAGGVLADASLARQRAGSVRATTAPKTNLARRLDARVLLRARTRRSRASPSRPSPRCSGPGTGWVRRRERRDGRGRRRASSRGVDAVSAQLARGRGAWRRRSRRYGGSNARASARSRPNRDSPRSPRSSARAIGRRRRERVRLEDASAKRSALPPACARRPPRRKRGIRRRTRADDGRPRPASATATIVDANAPSEAEIRSFVTRVVIDLTGNREVAPDEPLMWRVWIARRGQLICRGRAPGATSPAAYDYPTIAALHRSCAGKWAACTSIARLEARRTSRISRRGNRSRRPVAQWR